MFKPDRNNKDLSNGGKVLVIGEKTQQPLLITVNLTNLAAEAAFDARVDITYSDGLSFTEVRELK